MKDWCAKLLGMPPLASSNGQDVDDLIIYVHWLMLALFIGWVAYFCYAVWRFRASRNPKADYVGVTNHSSTYVELAVAGVEAVQRLIHPSAPTHLPLLALAGAIGYAGNVLASRIRLSAGRRLDSAALIADGHHARADAYVSLAVIASALVVAAGVPIADPIIGLVICAVILRITWQSWQTVSGRGHQRH